MEIEVKREEYTEHSTVGRMYVDGKFECFTLEDKVRPDGIKVYGETAIPAGRYRVVITFSNRFKKLMPLLMSVPGFEGIRIHAGNTDKDTHGCILVGQSKQRDSISASRLAYTALFDKISAARDQVWITVADA